MTAPIDIANRALGQIGAGKAITRFDENSAPADACARFYPVARDGALAAYDWAFARRYAQLAQLADAPLTRWRLAYRYPADCVKLRELLPERLRHHHRPDYVVRYEVASDAIGQTILTDLGDAIAVYTARVENPDAWSVPFTQCVVFLLASYIAIPISGDTTLATKNLEYYQQQLADASLHAVQESQPRRQRIRSSVEARW